MAEQAFQGLSPGLQNMLQSSGEAVTQATGKTEKKLEETTGRLKLIQGEKDALQAPKLPDLPPAPQARQTDPIQSFGSLAMMLAMFGGFLTKRHLETALNAGAGVLNAYKQNDAALAKQEYERWKASTDNALKIFADQQDMYKTALGKLDSDRNGALAELRAYAAAVKDDVMLQFTQQGNVAAILQLQNSRDEMGLRMKELVPKIEKANQEQKQAAEQAKLWQDYQTALASRDPEKISAAKEAIRAYNEVYNKSVPAAIIRSETSGGLERQLLDKWRADFKDANGRDPTAAEEEDEYAKIKAAAKPAGAGAGAENQIFQKWLSEWKKDHDGQAPSSEEQTAALKRIKESDRPPTAAQMRDQERSGAVNALLNYGDETMKGLDEMVSGIGAAGHIVRPTETIGNLLGLTDATTAHDFQTRITTLRNMALRLLNDRSILTGRDREDAENMIRGLELGSTVQNVRSSIQNVEGLLVGKYRDSLIRNGYMKGARELPKDLPPIPAGTADGTEVYDRDGKVVAVVKGGKYVAP